MESNNNSSSNVTKIIIAIGAVLVCCACVAIIAAGVLLYRNIQQQVPAILPTLLSPTESFQTPVPVPTLNHAPVDAASSETMNTLNSSLVPENDPYELACRLRGICNVSKTVPAPTTQFKVGDKQKFWLSNSDTNQNFQIDATLVYITPHTYFWAQDGSNPKESDIKSLMDTFENKIYPKDRQFFGSEWTPGVDNDPHIYVVYGGDIGSTIAGYFSSADENNPQIRKDSNGHEMFVINTSQNLGDTYTYATLAHEFVHMIQWPSDRNDVSWINEGFAEVGAFLNGYDIGGADFQYIQNPDLQLNTWPSPDSPDFGAHYGESFLYLTYFLDRYGETATKALTSNPMNDLPSVDDTLKTLNITDQQTGKVVTADDVFMDWAATLYLHDGNIGDGRYIYHNYSGAPQAAASETINTCPQSTNNYTVNQYGIDYIDIQCSGDHTLKFTGSTQASLLPVNPHSGSYAFWSNRGDESDMTLTKEFDLTSVSGPAELSYWTWYDLEKDYDYLYLEASIDGGQAWKIIKTPSSTDSNPAGNSFGWGYTGKSNDWIQEKVDLSEFSGKKVQLRFEYVTDAAVNGDGLLLDDISIDAIKYKSDFEADAGGWDAKGFVRVPNVLPQTYRLSLIIKGATTTVTPISLNADNTADIPLSLKSGEDAILIVTGVTRYTRIPAAYQIEVK